MAHKQSMKHDLHFVKNEWVKMKVSEVALIGVSSI